MQRLQRFGKTLRAMKDTYIDSFAHKERENDVDLNGQEHSLVSIAFTCALKRTNPNNNRIQRHGKNQSTFSLSLLHWVKCYSRVFLTSSFFNKGINSIKKNIIDFDASSKYVHNEESREWSCYL